MKREWKALLVALGWLAAVILIAIISSLASKL
jgi:hypothetical protein